MRLIDADEMLVNESGAYMSVQQEIDDLLTQQVNDLVHSRTQKLILAMPTVEAEPVRRGKWKKCDLKKLEHGFIERIPDGGVYCSECRHGFPKRYSRWNYCPSCGARMDGKDGENDDTVMERWQG